MSTDRVGCIRIRFIFNGYYPDKRKSQRILSGQEPKSPDTIRIELTRFSVGPARLRKRDCMIEAESVYVICCIIIVALALTSRRRCCCRRCCSCRRCCCRRRICLLRYSIDVASLSRVVSRTGSLAYR
jgi:hypothetical protein